GDGDAGDGDGDAGDGDGDAGDGDGDDADMLALLFDDAFVRGDTNFDGQVDISDPVATLQFLFQGGDAPLCMDSADANDSGEVDLSDAVTTLGLLFQGAESLPMPYPETGIDPTDDNFECDLLASN
ncbi:MAG: hypothetical protein AAF488_16560, partial [Planctomycetota bacterium]